MSTPWATKTNILWLLSQKRMTQSEIAKALQKAPSTINQHLNDLLQANQIRQAYNPYIIKWKYYEVIR